MPIKGLHLSQVVINDMFQLEVNYIFILKTFNTGRCSIVDYQGDVICDIYAKPKTTITDFRTRWSGLRKKDMVHAISFAAAQRKIKEILQVSIAPKVTCH